MTRTVTWMRRIVLLLGVCTLVGATVDVVLLETAPGTPGSGLARTLSLLLFLVTLAALAALAAARRASQRP